MQAVQQDFFLTLEESEMYEMRKNYNAIKISLEKVRRGTYCEINTLKKVCAEISARQEVIERNLCSQKTV